MESAAHGSVRTHQSHDRSTLLETVAVFDSVATGLVPLDLMGGMDTDFAHVQRAEYMPEVVYVGRLDQEKLISGWDIPHSLENLQAVIGQIHSQVMSVGVPVIVDSTTQVLLQRMSRIARVIGLLSLLIKPSLRRSLSISNPERLPANNHAIHSKGRFITK